MDSGRLQHLVTLQRRQSGEDDVGQSLTAWENVTDPVWADVRALSGLESIRADAQAALGKVSVRIRALTGVTAGMRFLHGTLAYQILAVPPVNNDPRYLDLPCEVFNATSV